MQSYEIKAQRLTLRSTLRIILQSSKKNKFILLISLVSYWLLYAFSSGMIFYYPEDVSELLVRSGASSFYSYISLRSILDIYFSGVVWFPNGHIQLNILLGPLIFSIILSLLFSLQIVVSIFLFRNSPHRLRLGSGSTGLLGLVPALFSGGCCSVPIGVILLGGLSSSMGLLTLIYDYPYVTNSLFSILTFVALAYMLRSARRFCNTQL